MSAIVHTAMLEVHHIAAVWCRKSTYACKLLRVELQKSN